jgi:hypothetical protein
MALFGNKPAPTKQATSIAPVNQPRPFFVRPDKASRKKQWFNRWMDGWMDGWMNE